MVIGFDELEEHERPPRRLWLDNERLTAWFKEIRNRRKERYSGKEIEDPVNNDAAKGLIADG
jgi:hypothetical protein